MSRQDPAAATREQAGTARKIGLIPCLAFAVGTMVGGGVFTLSGTAINHAGPAAIISYLGAGLVMAFSALAFVAVAARARPGDSGYGPIGDLLSPAWRFVAMWGFYLNGLTILTFLVVSFGDYLNQYFFGGIGPIPAALIATLAVVVLNLGPTALVGKAETYVVAAKIALLLVFVAVGLAHIGDADFTPFAPEGSSGITSTMALLFTAYTGFNVVVNMAGSVEKPDRTVPLAVMGSIAISAAIYAGVILAMLASGVEEFGAAGVGEAAQALMGQGGAYMIAFAACLSTLSGANANVLGTSELSLRLVAQGDVPPVLGRTSLGGHPYVSVLFLGAMTFVLVLVANVNNIVALANVGALVAMLVVNAACISLAHRGWRGQGMRLPGGYFVPALGFVTCLTQVPSLPWEMVLLGLGLVAAGLVLYAARHVRRLGEGRDRRARLAIEALETPLANALSVPVWEIKGIVRRIQDWVQRAGRNHAKQSGG
jgi:amino acid transporter